MGSHGKRLGSHGKRVGSHGKCLGSHGKRMSSHGKCWSIYPKCLIHFSTFLNNSIIKTSLYSSFNCFTKFYHVMASITKLSDVETLEQYRVALDNATANQTIAQALAELGFDQGLINEGKTKLTEARSAFDHNNIEDDETTEAYQDFITRREEIKDTYSLHRKKAKVIFRKDPVVLEQLALTGSVSKAYIKWLETLKKFYNTAKDAQEVITKLQRLKVTSNDINETLNKITQLESARSKYLQEKGESQQATQAKDSAIANIDDWMTEFYAVARIALEDKPQLLEALGKVVR